MNQNKVQYFPSQLMDNYQMLFLGSPISSSVSNRDISNSLRLFGDNNNFYGSNNNASDVDHDQVKELSLDFDGIGEASSSKYGDESEASTKGKSGTKKSDKTGKSHKFAFQTRSQIDVLDDGYRWRKYGQKIVKNSKFPRSYYKCTYQGCNVKKQIQRLCSDERIVVTTYEGIHTHSIEKASENFDQILKQIQTSCPPTDF